MTVSLYDMNPYTWKGLMLKLGPAIRPRSIIINFTELNYQLRL